MRNQSMDSIGSSYNYYVKREVLPKMKDLVFTISQIFFAHNSLHYRLIEILLQKIR